MMNRLQGTLAVSGLPRYDALNSHIVAKYYY